MRKEQRRTPRYTFIASAELIEQKTDVRIATRVSELGLHGCYLDMMNPFPQGTLVLVKIFAGEEFFHAKAKIVYVQPHLGAGVSFLEVEPQPLAVLGRWLANAQKDGKQPSS
ncbi:MAG TPA: PilZ domain-containing protein [Candidatus Acidoferrum sp.]|nr:PilZ domain-containing protein [Candidatus Acidoferrum sp.]